MQLSKKEMVTALYFGRFAGRKSAVLAAAFALLVNTAFLILRVRGLYLPRADDPSTAEQVGAPLLIAFSGVGLYRSIRRYKHSQPRTCPLPKREN